MTTGSDFSLAVVANACDGAAALRDRLADHGLDLRTVARLVNASPATIQRATTSGSTPRGTLIGMAALVTVLDRLAARGVTVAGVRRESAPDIVAAVEADAPLAAEMIQRIRALPSVAPAPVQLTFDAPESLAA